MRCTTIAFGVAAFFVVQTARAQSHVTCVGDSITEGDGASAPNKAYPAVLQSLLGAGYAVQNGGHSGATLLASGDLPYWTTSELARGTSWAAAGGDVVIQLGTNDTKPYNWAGNASFLKDCEALVDHYRAASPSTRVWINLPPPATADACCDIRGAVIEQGVLPLLRQCAINKGATTIDVHAALLPHMAWLTDGVHPNDAGAALIAQVVRDALVKLPSVTLTATATETNVTLSATPVAAYGRVERVRFYDGDVLLKELASAPWSMTLTSVAAGAHRYSAQVRETAGRTRRSAEISVPVANEPPGANETPIDAGVEPSPNASSPPLSAPSGSPTEGASSGGEPTEPAEARSSGVDRGCAFSPSLGQRRAERFFFLAGFVFLALFRRSARSSADDRSHGRRDGRWRITPLRPITNAPSALLTTAEKSSLVPASSAFQADPSQWRTSPMAPTAVTSEGPLTVRSVRLR